MKKRNVAIIIFIAFSALVALVLSAIYCGQIVVTIKEKAITNIYYTAKETASLIDQTVDYDYNVISNAINTNSAMSEEELVSFLHENNPDFLGFGYMDGQSLKKYKGDKVYSGFTLVFGSERLFGQKAVITEGKKIFTNGGDEKIIFYNFNDKYFAIKSFDSISDIVKSQYDDASYMLVSDSGYVYLNTYNNEQSLSAVFGKADQLTINELYSEFDSESNTVQYSFDGKDYYISAYKTLDGKNAGGYNIITIVNVNYLTNHIGQVIISTVIYVSAFGVAITVLCLCLFLRRREITSLVTCSFTDDRRYIVQIASDGRVISKNRLFSTSKFNTNNILKYDIEELTVTNVDNLKELLSNGNTLTIRNEEENKFLTFLINKSSIGYQLVGFTSAGKSNKVADYEAKTSKSGKGGGSGKGLVDNTFAFTDEIYGAYNRKALFSRIEQTLDLPEKKTNDLYFIMCGLKNHDEIYKYFGEKINEAVNFKLIELIKKVADVNEVYVTRDNYFTFVVKLKDDYNALRKLMMEFANEAKRPFHILSEDIEIEPRFGVYPFALADRDLAPTPRQILDKLGLANAKALLSKTEIYSLFDTATDSAIAKELQIATDIETGIANKEFVGYFQPIYSIKDRHYKRFECLLRWTNPKYRYESPFEYIKIAERTGFIHDIGMLTLRDSFQMIKDFRAAGHEDVLISVNVSPAQFTQTGFTNKFIDLFKEYDIPYSSIGVEITETFFMEELGDVINKLNYIRSFGVKVYLDDFGTGYSSLLYLAELPVDVIKIDMEFTKQIKSNEGVRTIISSLIQMANSLNIEIVAEGVEEAVQINFLEHHNCNYLQGWYFSKALPHDDALRVLEEKGVDIDDVINNVEYSVEH